MENGDATAAWSFFNVSYLQSVSLTLCSVSDKNDS
jgi:hypothetical protein